MIAPTQKYPNSNHNVQANDYSTNKLNERKKTLKPSSFRIPIPQPKKFNKLVCVKDLLTKSVGNIRKYS